VSIKAAFFDVGDTLVEHWLSGDPLHRKIRERLCAAFGERDWYDKWIGADIEPDHVQEHLREPVDPSGRWVYEPDRARQETNAWYQAWFRENGIDLDGIDLDHFRSAMCVPLDEVSVPATGAFDAVRWCKDRGLRVVLVSNTLSRGDEEIIEDWRRFGLADAIDGVVSSHSAGWRKPHPAIFQRALDIARVSPGEAFHVGDNLIADVWGAKKFGLRAVWRKTGHAAEGPEVEVRPDATIREMTELPGVVEPWLA
jgi:FMN phosphatase YigB (HAD superfamily)